MPSAPSPMPSAAPCPKAAPPSATSSAAIPKPSMPPASPAPPSKALPKSTSDGVIAPLFWLVLGGLPGIALYKAVNTANSMIGHKTERHREFGWASARFDDLLNLIPARLSALLIAGAAFFVKGRSPRNCLGHRAPRCKETRQPQCRLARSRHRRRTRSSPSAAPAAIRVKWSTCRALGREARIWGRKISRGRWDCTRRP